MTTDQRELIKLLTADEKSLFKKLNSPSKIQYFLDSLKINFEENGDTCLSPRQVVERQSAHCIEAALLAAAVMIFHNKKPYLLDLKANDHDFDHVVCLFKVNGRWGAFSKSNHVSLRYREPVYASTRELAMSYFHEYINSEGEKTLRSYSKPLDLDDYEIDWVVSEQNLWGIADDLDDTKHFLVVPKNTKLRRADKFEISVGNMVEWRQKSKKRTKKK